MQKYLPFRERFDRLATPLEFQSASGTISVASFGIQDFFEGGTRDTVHRSQITVIDYASKNDFIVRLNTMSQSDHLFLAKVSPAATLEDTLREVQSRVMAAYKEGSERSKIQEGEAMIVPIISLGVARYYPELVPAGISTDQDSQVRPLQVIRFRLDETGAKLKSYADYLYLGDDGSPRRFIFDKPFLLYLVRAGSQHPYLVVWIENEEVMELATPN